MRSPTAWLSATLAAGLMLVSAPGSVQAQDPGGCGRCGDGEPLCTNGWHLLWDLGSGPERMGAHIDCVWGSCLEFHEDFCGGGEEEEQLASIPTVLEGGSVDDFVDLAVTLGNRVAFKFDRNALQVLSCDRSLVAYNIPLGDIPVSTVATLTALRAVDWLLLLQ